MKGKSIVMLTMIIILCSLAQAADDEHPLERIASWKSKSFANLDPKVVGRAALTPELSQSAGERRRSIKIIASRIRTLRAKENEQSKSLDTKASLATLSILAPQPKRKGKSIVERKRQREALRKKFEDREIHPHSLTTKRHRSKSPRLSSIQEAEFQETIANARKTVPGE